MFDCHAHYGEPTDKALLCSASPEEMIVPEDFPFRSFGLIPEGGSKNLALLEEKIQDHSFLGEIGLDKRYPNLEEQIRIFRSALLLGKDKDTLISIHSVGHTDALLSILKEVKPKHFIIHGFTGSLETARAIEGMGGLISLSPRCQKAKSFQSLLTHTSFLVETDMKTGQEQTETLSHWVEELSHILDEDIGEETEKRFFSYISGLKVPTFQKN